MFMFDNKGSIPLPPSPTLYESCHIGLLTSLISLFTHLKRQFACMCRHFPSHIPYKIRTLAEQAPTRKSIQL